MGNFYSCTPASNTIETSRKYGWMRDLPDHRDSLIDFNDNNRLPLKMNVSKSKLSSGSEDYQLTKSIDTLPVSVDLRSKCPPIYDQGTLGSCTSQAIAAAYLYDENLQDVKDAFQPSRLYIYYNERMIEGTTKYDAGAQIRDGMKSINRWGVCHEKAWPYDIARFTDRPTDECYVDAMDHRAMKYHRLKQRSFQLKSALAQGFPVVFGIGVFESMETTEVAKTGDVPMPGPDEKMLGGHAILLVGYDDERKVWRFRNSWGADWGDEGYGTLPYKYLSPKLGLASDFWILEKVENDENDTTSINTDISEVIASY